MNSLRIKRNIMLSGANPVRGYLRTSSGEPPLTLTATYPDKMKIKLYGKSTQPTGTYYTANHTITESECNYSTRKLWFWGYYDGYVGNYYVFDGFAYWCFSLNSEFYEGNYYIDCLRQSIYKVEYSGIETDTSIAVTQSSTDMGYTDFMSTYSPIYLRTGNVYLSGGSSYALGTVNGKYANFTPSNNLIFGTKLLYDSYDSYALTLKYQRNKVYIVLNTSVGAGTFYVTYDGKFYRFTTDSLDAELRYYLDTANCAFYRHSDVGDPPLLANADLLSSTPSGATELTVDDVVSSYESITFTESATAAKKNWLTYPYVDTSKAENGVTWVSNSDGSITVSGTPTEFTMFTLCSSLVIPSGNYEVSFPTLENNNLLVSKTLNGTTTYYENPFSFTTTAETTIALKIRNKVNNYAIPSITFTVSLLADSKVLSAENIASRSYPDTVHPQVITSPTAGATVRGSNYLNTKGGYYSKQSSITIVSDGSIDVYIDNTSGGATVYSTMHLYNTNLLLTPGNTYTKICSSTNYIDNDSTQSLIEVGTSSTVISAIPESARITYINSSNTFVAQSYELTENIYNSVRFTFGVEAGKKLHKNYKINIVSGSTATPYEPYQSTDITITKDGQPVTLYGLPVTSDGNVTIGGQQYLSDVLTDNGDGTGTVTRYNFKKAFDGTESWLKNSDNGDYKSFYLQRSTDGSKSNVDEVCSHAPYISWVDGSFVGTYWWDAAASHGMRIDKKYLGSDYDTLTTDAERVARFKSYLASQYAAGTPVTVLYQLATPTTETVTITKSKAQNGTTVITSDCPYVGAEYYSWEES